MKLKKWTICLCSVFIGLFCLCGGAFLFTADNMPSQPDETIRAQYSADFYRETNDVSSTAIKIVNCTTGTVYTATTGSYVYVSYSSTDTLCVYINSSSYNYEISWLDNRNSEFTFINEYYIEGSNLYEILKYGNGIFLNIVASYSEKMITFDANGGSFRAATGNSSNNRVYSAGTLLFTFGGRNFYKKYAGYAYVSYAHRARRWTGPFLIGTTANSVAYYTSVDTSTVFTYSQTFSYNGTTYYLSAFDYSMGDCFDTSNRTYPYINTRDLVNSSHYGSGFNINLVIAQLTLDRAEKYATIWTESGTYTLPYNNPTRDGYTFAGWYTTSASTGGTQITTSTATPSYNRTVYARWTENTYDLCFEHPDDDMNPPAGTTTYEYVSYTDTFTFEAGACNTGYHFTYWEQPIMAEIYESGASVDVATLVYYTDAANGDTIYFYGYSEINSYTISFNANGGTGSIKSISTTYSSTPTMPTASGGISRTGYTLTGWCDSATGEFIVSPGGTLSIFEITDYLGCNTPYDDGTTITMYAMWTINTYTLSVRNGYYYSGSNLPVSLSVSSGNVSNSTLTKTNSTSTISHTYSTSPITITISSRTCYLWLYLDGTWKADGYNSISCSWTPNSDGSVLEWYIRETWGVYGYKSEGVSSIKFTGWGEGGTDYAVWVEGMPVEYTATLQTGYVFDGWYDESGVRKSTELTYNYGEVNTTVQMTAKAKKVYDKVKYDSSGQYFYFEDGYYPQTYAGDSMNSTLNSWYSSQSTVAEYYINNKKSYAYNYSGTWYARIYCPKSTTVTLKSGASKAFNAGTYYWFICNPIRWRVSNYGVGEDYYSEALYSKFVNAGCV
ncbi:MAG: InlB B-repeat-containing protein, partial [Clostridia bacterium]|nr:InlB B-repeat-containing protein [Clostridia bacterium]